MTQSKSHETEVKFLSTQQVARRFSVSTRTVWRLVARGDLRPPVALGDPKNRRWPLGEIEAFEARAIASRGGAR